MELTWENVFFRPQDAVSVVELAARERFVENAVKVVLMPVESLSKAFKTVSAAKERVSKNAK